ncbi:efflux RND transporter periplasmic adaptor subunit [Amphritea sp. 1_MG-2023]|uniref:efflux RND transporter periplasmic adaptor subunit n=1 Tax=Amphritea sp. 1_MG-2023 TaxID=3062670 RepID=UPI0026E34D7C|nr:efflux RND transporter periplasmic adaptor subunit [Amphritea sp. 1_MG-2023]MDO6563435.1 efflux RND transporter periplasmic adaptor subunit [Amphritea sp. 1_MG-2023]
MKKQLLVCMVAIGLVFVPFSNPQAEELTLSTLGCMLEPSEKVDISSPVIGVLDKVMVKRGDHVKKGQLLFQLKAGVEREGVQLAKVRAEFARRKEQRNKDLYDDDILTASERDEIETELLIAKSELRLKQQELALRRVSSPIKGVVVNRFNNAGEFVNTDPILSLATLDPLHVDLLLPASDFGLVSLNQELLIKPDSEMLNVSRATVIIVDPLIDSASGTFRVQLVMQNPDGNIPAGIRCATQTVNQP